MRTEDILQVMEVERESFPTMWPPTAFKREIQQNRLAHYIVVAERNPEAAPDAGAMAEMVRSPRFARILEEVRYLLKPPETKDALPAPEERPELIVGFAGVWALPEEAHLVTIASRESHRRRGLGELLLIHVISLARRIGESEVTLEVRVSNEPAISLYRKYGFEEVGVRPRYYSDNKEDALILTATGIQSPGYVEMFERLRSAHAERWGVPASEMD